MYATYPDTTIRLIDFGLARPLDEANPIHTQYVVTRWSVYSIVLYSIVLTLAKGTALLKSFLACTTMRSQISGESN